MIFSLNSYPALKCFVNFIQEHLVLWNLLTSFFLCLKHCLLHYFNATLCYDGACSVIYDFPRFIILPFFIFQISLNSCAYQFADDNVGYFCNPFFSNWVFLFLPLLCFLHFNRAIKIDNEVFQMCIVWLFKVTEGIYSFDIISYTNKLNRNCRLLLSKELLLSLWNFFNWFEIYPRNAFIIAVDEVHYTVAKTLQIVSSADRISIKRINWPVKWRALEAIFPQRLVSSSLIGSVLIDQSEIDYFDQSVFGYPKVIRLYILVQKSCLMHLFHAPKHLSA